METITKVQKKADSTKKNTSKKLKISDLSKLYGWGEGKIFYDESIFNLGKRRVKA